MQEMKSEITPNIFIDTKAPFAQIYIFTKTENEILSSTAYVQK